MEKKEYVVGNYVFQSVEQARMAEKEKKMIIAKERKKRLREELEKKILEEYRLKEEAEAKKNKKEQEEIDLVKRLQTTTQIQQNSKFIIIYVFFILYYS